MKFIIASNLYWLSVACAICLYDIDGMQSVANYLLHLQMPLMAIATILCILKPNNRAKSILLLICCYMIYTGVTDFFFLSLPSVFYVIETMVFFSLHVWLIMRPQISVGMVKDSKNVQLAFYVGKKGTFWMHFFELFGLPVKSVMVIANNKCLKLDKDRENFELKELPSVDICCSEYLVIDTGVKATLEIEAVMNQLKGTPASNSGSLWQRWRCVSGIMPILSMMGSEWLPSNVFEQIPSVYIRKCLERRICHA